MENATKQIYQDMVAMWAVITTLLSLNSNKAKGEYLTAYFEKHPRLRRYFRYAYDPSFELSSAFDDYLATIGQGTPNFAELAATRVKARNLCCGLGHRTLNRVFALLDQPPVPVPPVGYVLEVTGGINGTMTAEFRHGDVKIANMVLYQTKETKPFLDALRLHGITVNIPNYLE